MRKFTDGSRAGALLLALVVFAGTGARAYEDGAPPGHTGGFGESDCRACHSDNDRNSAEGTLTLHDRPAREDGQPRLLVLVLEHPELRSGGFQLAIRTAEGDPAGRLIPLSNRTRIVAEGDQQYLQHSPEGREPQQGGRISWKFEWVPPEEGRAIVHVAANAANDDLSALGDFIFTLEKTLAIGAHAEPAPSGESRPGGQPLHSSAEAPSSAP